MKKVEHVFPALRMESFDAELVFERCLDGRIYHRLGTYHSTRREDPTWMRRLLEALTLREDVDVAYLHCCEGMLRPSTFEALLGFIRRGKTWGLNLGELDFDENQLDALVTAVQSSEITHAFVELKYGRKDEAKERLLAALRTNRTKHRRWVLAEAGDEKRRDSIRRCTQMWFEPMDHSVNQ